MKSVIVVALLATSACSTAQGDGPDGGEADGGVVDAGPQQVCGPLVCDSLDPCAAYAGAYEEIISVQRSTFPACITSDDCPFPAEHCVAATPPGQGVCVRAVSNPTDCFFPDVADGTDDTEGAPIMFCFPSFVDCVDGECACDAAVSQCSALRHC